MKTVGFVDDEGNELVTVQLQMRRRNYDALVKADEKGEMIPCAGIAFCEIDAGDDSLVPIKKVIMLISGSPHEQPKQFYGWLPRDHRRSRVKK